MGTPQAAAVSAAATLGTPVHRWHRLGSDLLVRVCRGIAGQPAPPAGQLAADAAQLASQAGQLSISGVIG